MTSVYVTWTQCINYKWAHWRKDHKIIAHLKNSFFSSSVFKVRLLRKFITSRKSFLFREKYLMCLKTNHSQYELIRAEANNHTHLKKSWVSRELRGGRDKGSEFSRPICRVFFKLSDSSCDTETTKKREEWTNVREGSCAYWYNLTGRNIMVEVNTAVNINKTIVLLTKIIQVTDQSLHHHAKGVTVPRVSIFLWKHFKALNLSTTCVMRTCEQKRKFFHSSVMTYSLLTCSSGGIQLASLTFWMLVRNLSWRKQEIKT